jgi:RHS repeat-associated protein
MFTYRFTCDDLGNWLTYTNNATAQTRLHNEVNEITKIGTTEMLYDAAGNLTKDAASGNGPYRYFYDAENRLTRMEQDDSTAVATYVYNADGLRIQFVDEIAAVTKRYLYDGPRVIEEIDDSATPARQRYYLWGNTIDELLLLNDDAGDDSNYFVCHDQIYSPSALISSTGSVAETYLYHAYGLPIIFTADGGDGDWWDGDETTSAASAKGLVYLFTGRELDNLDSNALKLYYYRMRTYSPTLGRFIQRDPLEYVDGMSLYQYASSDPIILTDPLGGCGGSSSTYYEEPQLWSWDMVSLNSSESRCIVYQGTSGTNKPQITCKYSTQSATCPIVLAASPDPYKSGTGWTPQGVYGMKRPLYKSSTHNGIDWIDLWPDGGATNYATPSSIYKRSNMGLHPGGRSNGCVTVESTSRPLDDDKCWNNLRNIVTQGSTRDGQFYGYLYVTRFASDGTDPGPVTVASGLLNPDWEQNVQLGIVRAIVSRVYAKRVADSDAAATKVAGRIEKWTGKRISPNILKKDAKDSLERRR